MSDGVPGVRASGTILQVAAQDYAFKVHLLPLVHACEDAGFRVICCSEDTGFAGQLPIEHVHVPFSRSYRLDRHLGCLRRLITLIREEEVGLVHGHTLVAGLLSRLAARLAGVRAVAYTAHGFRFHEQMSFGLRALYGSCEWVGARCSDLIFFQNADDRKVALGLGMGRADRLITIGSGIDTARFDPRRITGRESVELRERLRIPPGSPVVSFVGRPTKEKGVDLFLELGERLFRRGGARGRAPVYCVSVLCNLPGERHGLPQVVEKMREHSNFRVLSFTDEIPSLLAISDVLVLPTQFEGCSRVLMEAMSMGTPVVAHDVRGCRELVENGHSGFLVPPGDVDRLVECVSLLIDDRARQRRMSRQARRVSRARFAQDRSIAMQVEALTQLYQSTTIGSHELHETTTR